MIKQEEYCKVTMYRYGAVLLKKIREYFYFKVFL